MTEIHDRGLEGGIGRALELLHAYHDGELSSFARRRFEQRLRRSPELRAELDSLSEIGVVLREDDATGPTPDLWDDIALRLPAIDARRHDAEATRARNWLAWLFGPGGAALATAAAAAALAVAVWWPAAPDRGNVVRWVDAGGRSVLVLDGAGDTTIIWVLDDVMEGASRGGGHEVV